MNREQTSAWIGLLGLAAVASVGCQSSNPAADSGPSRAWVLPVGHSNGGWEPTKESEPLRVGDPAPALHVDSWLQGKPVTGFSKFRVYAVAFWSPTSGPSVESLAHLSRIQRDNEDVVVIGVAATDRAPESGQADERLMDLRTFIASRSDEISFRVGFDSQRVMRESWLFAAGQTGIPSVFVVGRDGKIAWIGHPDDMDEPIAAALRAGRGWVWSQD